MSVKDQEIVYNELMNNAPTLSKSEDTKTSETNLKESEVSVPPQEYSGGVADAKLDEAINKYLNGAGFSYNTAEDPEYQSYVKEYKENAKRSKELSRDTADMLANGYEATYADTIADTVNNSYLENITDAIPNYQSLAKLEKSANEQNLANAVNIYSNQAQSEYNRNRDTVADNKNYLNYLYNRYVSDRQADIQNNSNDLSIYGAKLSAAQSDLDNVRSIDNQRYLNETLSADEAAKIEYDKRQKQLSAEQEAQEEETQRRIKRNSNDFINAYNLKDANADFITNQIAIGYYNGYISLAEVDYIADQLNITTDQIANKLDIYGKNGGSFTPGKGRDYSIGSGNYYYKDSGINYKAVKGN